MTRIAPEDLRELENAAAKIPVQGARYPELLQKLVGRGREKQPSPSNISSRTFPLQNPGDEHFLPTAMSSEKVIENFAVAGVNCVSTTFKPAPRRNLCLESTVNCGNVRALKKILIMLVALGLAWCAGRAEAALINGRNYVALADWARANGLNAVWSKRGAEIIVTNRTTRLVFDVDSAQAEINGVNVRLSFAVANVKGAPFIAQLDVDKTLRPLLFPARYLDPQKITTICIDPGHGGKDSGNRVGGRFFGNSEKTYTLALALELRDQLKRAGFNVILTRSKDVYPELPARPALANKAGADLFVSLHFNAAQSGKNEVDGPETYCITPVGASSSNAQGEGGGSGATTANRCENKSLLFAYQMQKALVQYLRADDRGVRRARFAVLRDAAMPAILIEGGYMTHPVESKKIFDPAYRKQMAAAIVKGILNYQKLSAPPAPPAPPPRTNPAGASKTAGGKTGK